MRLVRVANIESIVRRAPSGAVYLNSSFPLGPYPVRLTERLDDWADAAPDRTFLAQRDADGEWRHV